MSLSGVSEPDPDAGEGDRASVQVLAFLVPGGSGSVSAELVHGTFHAVAVSVALLVEVRWSATGGALVATGGDLVVLGRDRGLDPALRIQQCAEGWHRDTEPEQAGDEDDVEAVYGDEAVPDDGSMAAADADKNGSDVSHGGRRIRSTRRRQDVPDLPRVPMEARMVGRSFTGRDGRTYRPSHVPDLDAAVLRARRARHGVPVDPEPYDYRRAALDALHFPKLVDRFWQNLRRCAGYTVQYFAAVEPQTPRPAPACRTPGRDPPRQVIRQVAAPPTCSCGGRPSTSPSTSTSCPGLGRRRLRRPATPGRPCRPGTRRSTSSTLTRTRNRRMWCGSGPARHRRHHRPLRRCGPGRPLPDQVPDQVDRRHLHRQRRHADPAYRARTSTGCTPSCAGCRARRAARTGCGTASNPTAGPGCGRAACPARRMIGRTSGSAAAGSWCPGSGPARPWAQHRADRATVVREALDAAGIARPGDGTDGRHRPRPMANPGSCGPIADPTPQLTSGSCSPRSRNGNAGGPNTRPRRQPDACGQLFGNRTGTVTRC